MTRAEYIEALGRSYRRVLGGLGGEAELGKAIARAQLTPGEMAILSKMARGGTDAAPVEYGPDLTRGGRHYPEVL